MAQTKHYKKKMTPKGVDFVKNAPVTLSKSIEINAPIEKVWNVIDDTPNYTEWFPGVRWGKFEIESETGMGAKRLAQLNNIKYYEEMIAYNPNKEWGFTMLEATNGMCKSISELISLEDLGNGKTKVTYQGGYEFNGFFRLLSGILKRSVNKIWDGALNGLKGYSEKKEEQQHTNKIH